MRKCSFGIARLPGADNTLAGRRDQPHRTVVVDTPEAVRIAVRGAATGWRTGRDIGPGRGPGRGTGPGTGLETGPGTGGCGSLLRGSSAVMCSSPTLCTLSRVGYPRIGRAKRHLTAGKSDGPLCVTRVSDRFQQY
ncbi:hypothetical protein NIIDMKKI_46910 [Mycobacterium kansasii]|uniref:Uncharacterized protein n=1 Tax=Mycobacterium kansasii TaxID=1768 RepID=A0A7G1IIA4_MYCKA|nr:hypothetical protein NIIDMKKI_46910 [Mycobacterium kansasii]